MEKASILPIHKSFLGIVLKGYALSLEKFADTFECKWRHLAEFLCLYSTFGPEASRVFHQLVHSSLAAAFWAGEAIIDGAAMAYD